jgi:hypothetical protein
MNKNKKKTVEMEIKVLVKVHKKMDIRKSIVANAKLNRKRKHEYQDGREDEHERECE